MIPSVVASQIKNCVADYLRTTFHPTTSGFENLIHHFLQTPNQYYRGPYINIGLPFRPSDHQGEPFPEIPLGFQPHRHQAIAFQRLSPPNYQSTIVATGTGSGKTECFLLPILEHCRQQQRQQGIKAILIYPMNALATDQAKRIAQLIDKHPSLQGKVTAGLYVGDQEDKPMLVMSENQIITDRYTLRNSPPDILLTNYKMLDLLLMQPENQTLWRNNQSETLRYLVVDEFHTFDGAQGTDLACLLRRLKHRLKTPENYLVCVGTSATLGSEETRKEMVHYAQDIFQETFEPDSLITESRLTVKEFLRLDEVEDLLMVSPPNQEQLALLKPESYSNPHEFIYAQARLWLKQNCPPIEIGEDLSLEWQLALGKTLKQLPLIHNVLRFFDDQGKGTLVPRTYIELGEKLETLLGISPHSDRDYILALIDSLLSLMAIARTEIEKHDGSKLIVPWVNLRVQVWFRELKRMVASIESEPKLLFSDDLKPEQLSKALPVMHCRSCGATGWAGLRPQQGMDKLSLNNLQDFYQAFFARRRSPNLAFIFPCKDEQQQENIKQFCPQCLTLNAPRQTSCQSCGHQDLIRVQVPDISDTETENGQKYTVSKSDCPFCKNPNGLSILGAQSASLTSAMIGVLFTSPFNTDKKLLTFSDSVQDAAHRAGFYTARTYNTTLRTAIAKSLQDAPENITLAEFIPYFSDYWQAKFPRQADFVATFLPNDLGWLREWDEFLQSDRQELSPTSTLIERFVKPRLEWEIITQFGHRAAVGPSLERSGICSLQFLPAQLQQTASLLQKRLSNEIEALRGIAVPDLHPYLLGFLHHLRLQGAIFQPATKSYIQDSSEVFLLGKPYYMPNIGPGNPKPKFLANHSANAQHFETLAYRGKRSQWSEDWARRCLQSISLLLQEQLIEVLHQTLECLEEVGLLQVEKCGGGRAWGLPQSQLHLSLSAQIFACNQCGSSLTSSNQEANIVEGMVCLKQGCSGYYQPAPENALSYYRKLYQQGEIHRIYALEHTGLLTRENRERLENRFIQGDRLGDPNLLSATSTLEMGINIGDLSSVVLCSIPPNTANFQQRLGRAGRTDGNAFATAIANGKAHDLYFYSNPVKMIQGNINPAGCYLDASAILERQLAAFCLDNWVCHSSETAAIPKQLRDILNNLNGKKSDKFPYTWLDYIEQHQTQLLTDFLALFQGAITEETSAQLCQFMNEGQGNKGGLRWTILNHFEGINREVTRLRSQQANIREKIKKYKLQPVALQNDEELAELEQEKKAFMELIRNIEIKNVLNFLTDEGFLPNYAFPESGVTLRSIIWRKTETTETEGKRYDHQTLEYERPGRVAIRELVPGGTFYAEGRKVKIDQVDLQLSKPQDWRFCPNCSYAIEAARSQGKQKTCPRCHHSLWSDQGQVRKMLKLQQVFARTSDKKSRFGDDTEERQPSFFQRSLLVDFDPEHRERTLLNTDETFPFGLEYIAKTTFREINLGENTSNGESLTIGGDQFSTKGFRVCGGCGKEMTPKNEPKDHAINCQYRHKTDRAKSLEVLYLYRQFESESIRFLMPNEGFWSDKGLHSFIAALQLGLKEKFKGKVDHLNVAISEEPQIDSSIRKSFLYLYDSVPSGTGYLKQLIRDPEKLKDVFLKAQKIVTACGCEDGCYECLFAYRNSFNQDQTSRNTAKKLLKSLLKHWETLQVTKDSLSSIRVNVNFDSELEKNFVEAIKRYKLYPNQINLSGSQDQPIFPELKKEIFNGKTGYLLTIGQEKWRIETQVTLNERDSVAIQTRADFVFYPISRNRPELKPIAIYTDGWEYHQDRLQDDFEKRLAILRSHNYLCWSLTWEDVNSHYQEQEQRLDLPLNGLITGLNEQFHKNPQAVYEQYQCQDLQNLESQDSFVWLMHYLAKPDPLLWQRWALFRIFIQADFSSLKNQSLQTEWIQNITQQFGEIAIENWRSGNPIFVGEVTVSSALTLGIAGDLARHRQATADASFVAIQLQPESETITHHSLKIAWREALRLLNLYQFLDPVYITLADQTFADALIVEPLPPQKSPWENLQSLILDADVLAQLPNLIAQNVPVGEPGYELCDQSGEVLAIAELAWVNAQIALTTTAEDHQQFIAQGWQSWQCADFFEQLTTIIPLIQR